MYIGGQRTSAQVLPQPECPTAEQGRRKVLHYLSTRPWTCAYCPRLQHYIALSCTEWLCFVRPKECTNRVWCQRQPEQQGAERGKWPSGGTARLPHQKTTLRGQSNWWKSTCSGSRSLRHDFMLRFALYHFFAICDFSVPIAHWSVHPKNQI